MTQAGPKPIVTGCCHHGLTARTCLSELKGEDVLLLEHRPWPARSVAHPTPGGTNPGQLASGLKEDSARGMQLMLAEKTASGSSMCTSCGTDLSHYDLLAVFDGHNGAAAARFAAKHAPSVLDSQLPPGGPLEPHSPGWDAWCCQLQQALVSTLLQLEAMFAGMGVEAGSTATLVLVTGRLLTCVAVGDSSAVVDTGRQTMQLTVDHRLAAHRQDRQRITQAGAYVAPIDASGYGPAAHMGRGIGPLRVWPGGLCLSRAIGDFDVGETVLAVPHLTQVLLPPTGGRLLLATDGVWDAWAGMGPSALRSILRSSPLDVAAARMVGTIIQSFGSLRDDATVIVADILPAGTSWPSIAKQLSSSRRSRQADSVPGGGLFCGCFGGASLQQVAEEVREPIKSLPGEAEVLADLDIAAAMGLMPEGCSMQRPDWLTEAVRQQMLAVLASASEAWQRASGLQPPQAGLLSSLLREATQAAAVAEAAMVAELAASLQHAAGRRTLGELEQQASQHFRAAVAANTSEYAERFGPYSIFPSAQLCSPIASQLEPESSKHVAAPVRDPGTTDVTTRLRSNKDPAGQQQPSELQKMLAAGRSPSVRVSTAASP